MTASFPYKLLVRNEIIQRVNDLSTDQIPFLFIIDYRAENGFVIPSDEIDENFIRFEINSTDSKENYVAHQDIQ